MRIDILTLFPEMVETVLKQSIIGRADDAGLIKINVHNIRDFSKDKHKRVDDTPYGGGMGMLLAAPPIYDCYMAVTADAFDGERIHTVYMSPQGKVLSQKKAEQLSSSYDRLVILCGHYEGVDERIIEEIVDEEISIGDYVLTGGELPACILTDCVCRLIDGVLSDKQCHTIESISCGMLEYPQYTRPAVFNGKNVPSVLLGGNHAEIEKWRFEEAVKRTLKKRPDLM